MGSDFVAKQKVKNNIRDEIKEMMEGTFGQNVDMGPGGVISAAPPMPRLETLSQDIMCRIVLNLTNVNDYEVPQRARNIGGSYGLKRREMTKFVWRMSGICASFNNFFNNLPNHLLKQFPKPTIGLRIQPKVPKCAMKHVEIFESPMVSLYIYGYFSKNNFVLCCKPHEIAPTLYPAVVQTQLIIQSFVLDDGLIEMIRGIDTSKVEEVYFNDIKGVDLNEYSVADIANLFPNAMEIRFLGDSRFEGLATIADANVPDMEKTSLDNIQHGDLVAKYHGIDFKCKNRTTISRNRRRLVRETDALGDPQPFKKNDNEVKHKALKRLTSYLNTPPAKQTAEQLEANQRIAELESQLRSLRSRYSKLESTA